MLCLLTSVAAAQVTERVNVGPGGYQSNGVGDLPQAGSFVSDDGRFVVFMSSTWNLVPNDTNAADDIFLRDRLAGTVERVSVDSAGGQSNGGSGLFGLTMTPDARYVAFYSEANNLVPGDTNGVPDVFLRDRLLGTTERVSLASSGAQGNAMSQYPALSPDGRFVAFASNASNLVQVDANGTWDVFVRDRASGTTQLASGAMSGAGGDGYSLQPAISGDGRYLAFYSRASNLVPGDTNGRSDIFVVDCLLGTTTRVSVSSSGVQGNFDSGGACISADGRLVGFSSQATNLVPYDTNGGWDAFVHDRQTGITERINVSTAGTESDGSANAPFLSSDGRFAVFWDGGSNLVPGAVGGIYVRDRRLGTTDYASPPYTGGTENGSSIWPSVSANGRYVVFRSSSTNLVPGDTNHVDDIFLRDRLASGFASLCHPGTGGVIPCPCGNPPSSAGRGCDNSTATGGAVLSASGIAYLSQDSLVFAATGEPPSATSVLLRGDALIPPGTIFGQGVRCAGGMLKRLYVKQASGGNIIAPDLASGNPTVSVRCAALGVPIQPGVPYPFLVYYRDPIVLGGCPAPSTFNATQTGTVSYWP